MAFSRELAFAAHAVEACMGRPCEARGTLRFGGIFGDTKKPSLYGWAFCIQPAFLVSPCIPSALDTWRVPRSLFTTHGRYTPPV
eukprot:gene39074-48261_t